MRKIFGYECRRLLWNKFFLGLLLVILFYGWQVLNGVTVLGVSHTAPFSPWSFGDYLSIQCRRTQGCADLCDALQTISLWVGTMLFCFGRDRPSLFRSCAPGSCIL